jgi:choline dehydrogenase-like flavoprotein
MVVRARPEKVDAVIVGSGAAGSLFAARLAEAGRSVVILEAGPARQLSDLLSSQIWARRLKWGGAPVVHAGGVPSFPHNLNTGSGTGGAALHHYGTWPRMPAIAFRMKSALGVGADWPMTPEELRPHYDRVQAEVGIAGDAAAEPWRPEGDPYPLPPLRTFAQGTILQRGFERIGLAVAPLPAAIATAPFGDRAACLYDGWCDAGCPIRALANPLTTWLPRALAAGAELRHDATAVAVMTAPGGRASGVRFADGSGEQQLQEAGVVVLAVSAIQAPRLLLASADGGLGNDNGLLGRGLMVDAVAPAYGLFADETENHMGVAAGQLIHRAVPGDGRNRPPGGYQWQIGPSLKPNDIFGIAMTRPDLFGSPLHRFMARAAHHLASQVAMIEQLPDPANRVALAAERDRFGMPLAQITHRFAAATLALQAHCSAEGQTVMQAAGAEEVWAAPMGGGHPAGGTPMGSNPATSVTDGYGRLHAVPNLFVTGSGLFPNTAGTSPTFTLLALADRAAGHLLEHWRDHLP